MTYTEEYESQLIRGKEEPRPWDLLNIVKKLSNSNFQLLDIGCGTALKLLPLASDFKKIYGIEPNFKMRNKALKNILDNDINNFSIIEATAEDIPFKDNYFDFVTVMMAKHNTKEIYRVLKNDGIAVLEKVGERDKINLKEPFGSDEKGLRGQFSNYKEGERAIILEQEFKELFKSVDIKEGFFNTYYTPEGLELLLKQTPTIRDFDPVKDRKFLDYIIKHFMTDKGIVTKQHRILIIAQK